MSTYKSFAVIGAGNFGQPMVKALSQYPESSVVVLLRKGGSVHAHPSNVSTVTVDYKDSAAITEALREHKVEVVVSTVGTAGLEAQKEVADAAKAAGVKLFVPSEYGLPTEGVKEGLLAVKYNVIEHLKSIGLPFARYYNGYFSDFVPWLGGSDEAGKFYIVGKGDKPASFTSVADSTGFVAYTLNKLPPSKLKNATFRIEGTRATLTEVGALYGGKFPVEHVDVIPSGVSLAEVRTYLQQRAEEGAGSTGWDITVNGEGAEKAGSSNNLWEGHRFEPLKEVLGL